MKGDEYALVALAQRRADRLTQRPPWPVKPGTTLGQSSASGISIISSPCSEAWCQRWIADAVPAGPGRWSASPTYVLVQMDVGPVGQRRRNLNFLEHPDPHPITPKHELLSRLGTPIYVYIRELMEN